MGKKMRGLYLTSSVKKSIEKAVSKLGVPHYRVIDHNTETDESEIILYLPYAIKTALVGSNIMDCHYITFFAKYEVNSGVIKEIYRISEIRFCVGICMTYLLGCTPANQVFTEKVLNTVENQLNNSFWTSPIMFNTKEEVCQQSQKDNESCSEPLSMQSATEQVEQVQK